MLLQHASWCLLLHAGTLLATGSDDLHICLWDLQSSRPIVGHNTGHTANIFCVKFLPTTGWPAQAVQHICPASSADACSMQLSVPAAFPNSCVELVLGGIDLGTMSFKSEPCNEHVKHTAGVLPSINSASIGQYVCAVLCCALCCTCRRQQSAAVGQLRRRL